MIYLHAGTQNAQANLYEPSHRSRGCIGRAPLRDAWSQRRDGPDAAEFYIGEPVEKEGMQLSPAYLTVASRWTAIRPACR